MGYYLFILGCQYNYYDGEKISQLLDSLGYFSVPEKDADLIITLACSVRQKAVDRILGKLKKWQSFSQKPKTIITACVLPKDQKFLEKRVDLIVGSEELIENLEKYLKKIGTPLPARQGQALRAGQFPIFEAKEGAYIPITSGCNNWCTFCAVPITRGREISRSKEAILREVDFLAKKEVKKIVLLGQNVNSYGLSNFRPRDLRKNRDPKGKPWTKGHPSPFVELLREIEKNKGIEEISFLSPNPQDMSEDLIDWMKGSKKFSRRLNLPVQSGSDEILKRMNRRYSSREYLALVEKIKKAVPEIFLSTDIIVGFSGETEKDFQQTIDLVKKAQFKKAFIGKYSPRPGTASAKYFPDDVGWGIKKKRFEVLNKLINKNSKS